MDYDWWALPGGAGGIGIALGVAASQWLLIAVWRKAMPDSVIGAVIAAVFTRQGFSACGHAPGPLPFHEVLYGAIAALVLGLYLWNAQRAEKAQAAAEKKP